MVNKYLSNSGIAPEYFAISSSLIPFCTVPKSRIGEFVDGFLNRSFLLPSLDQK